MAAGSEGDIEEDLSLSAAAAACNNDVIAGLSSRAPLSLGDMLYAGLGTAIPPPAPHPRSRQVGSGLAGSATQIHVRPPLKC